MTNIKHMVMGEDFLIGDPMEAPPVCHEGFERAPDNEFVLLKKLPECTLREEKLITKRCCGETRRIFCGRTKAIVTRKDCLDCDAPVIEIGGNHADTNYESAKI